VHISVRNAASNDIPSLVTLYCAMEAEQVARKTVWALTDGLDESIDSSLLQAMESDNSWLLVGQIDSALVGFVFATIEPMLERAKGERIGRIRLIYTEPAARGVGVGHEMLEAVLEQLRSLRIRRFDAPVGPGQRAAKNFFESHRFAARSIIMHHTDDPTATDA